MGGLDVGSWIVIVLCSVAALTDARTGLIPNALTFPVILGAPLVHGFVAGPGALLASLVGALLCGLAPYVMFRRGGMGGGDVKLFAAVGATVGVSFGLQVQLVSMAVAALWGLGVLAYEGQLLQTLRRTLSLLLGPLWPKSWRFDVGHDALVQLRLGVPIHIARIDWPRLTQRAPGRASAPAERAWNRMDDTARRYIPEGHRPRIAAEALSVQL